MSKRRRPNGSLPMTKSAFAKASKSRPCSPGRESTARIEVTEAEFRTAASALLTLQYANSAEISRINKGLKRRRDQTVLGFMIDPRTGYWAKTEDEDPETELPPDAVRPVRIVPIVRDRKNALLLRFEDPERFDPGTVATVQHALLRGIAVEFQLEEGEILENRYRTGKTGAPSSLMKRPKAVRAY